MPQEIVFIAIYLSIFKMDYIFEVIEDRLQPNRIHEKT